MPFRKSAGRLHEPRAALRRAMPPAESADQNASSHQTHGFVKPLEQTERERKSRRTTPHPPPAVCRGARGAPHDAPRLNAPSTARTR